ncbi:sensor histidine kinase, partial [Cohnella zeiphila]
AAASGETAVPALPSAVASPASEADQASPMPLLAEGTGTEVVPPPGPAPAPREGAPANAPANSAMMEVHSDGDAQAEAAATLSVTESADGVTVAVYGKSPPPSAKAAAPVEVADPAPRRELTVLAEDRESESVFVYADRKRIGQVLTNLVSNAVRHTPEEGCIELGLRIRGGNLEWFVRNEGPAIPEADLTRIWEPFFRGDKARSRDRGGTGIGLAVTKQILELHGGRFGAANRADGVEFCFSLPLPRKEPPPANANGS